MALEVQQVAAPPPPQPPAVEIPTSPSIANCGTSGEGTTSKSEGELPVFQSLPRHSKVIVIGNNRTKQSLVGLQGVVTKSVGLGGWHWLVRSAHSARTNHTNAPRRAGGAAAPRGGGGAGAPDMGRPAPRRRGPPPPRRGRADGARGRPAGG